MRRLISGLLVSLALAGCNSGGSDSQFVRGVGDPTQSCPSNMTCGFMKAPKDYGDPDGETVDIYYGVHKAQDPANRIGALLLNFGGPSAEAVLGTSMMAAYYLPQEILDRFDIVGMDPRGAGQSAFARELTECAVAEYRETGSCDTTYQQVAPYLGSNSVVKDMDRLRELLGDDQLSFLGYSYGTRLGSLYADMFPHNVRAIVLDSPMSPTDANNVEIRIGNAAGYEKVAGFRLDYDTHANRETKYQQIVGSLFTQPALAYTANDGGVLSLGDGAEVMELTVARESSGDWENIDDQLIELLDDDNAYPLLNALSNSSSWVFASGYSPSDDDLRGNAMFKAVVCTDESAPLTDEEMQASQQSYKDASSLYGLLTYYQTAELCSGWTAQRDPITKVTGMDIALGGRQILIIGGQYDPATPYSWAQEMVASFGTSASLVTIDDYVDHGFSYNGIDCLDQNTTAYLLDPSQEISEQTCTKSSYGFGKRYRTEPEVPHPVKDVIGW